MLHIFLSQPQSLRLGGLEGGSGDPKYPPNVPLSLYSCCNWLTVLWIIWELKPPSTLCFWWVAIHFDSCQIVLFIPSSLWGLVYCSLSIWRLERRENDLPVNLFYWSCAIKQTFLHLPTLPGDLRILGFYCYLYHSFGEDRAGGGWRSLLAPLGGTVGSLSSYQWTQRVGAFKEVLDSFIPITQQAGGLLYDTHP